MGKLIFIAGGTGFMGRRLIEALRGEGYKVRCLVRTREKAGVCTALDLDFAVGDITDRESLRGALEGAGMVVHLVGIIAEKGKQTFKEVHVRGTLNLLDEARAAGVGHFFYQSALGADPGSWAAYLRTKAEAEELVRASGLPYTIFRPSLVVGGDDGFITKIKDMVGSISPVIPLPGEGRARFQPMYVGDWVGCLLKIIDNPEAIGKTYEIGGPEHLTYEEIVRLVALSMGSLKPIFHVPPALVRFSAPLMGIATSEQIRLLDADNICDPVGVKKNFGFEPLTFKEALRLFIKNRAVPAT
ncbi:MAG: complex I NDUFA9 subunit family protein [Thermodesulfovibrionales bacterium]|nr:complex I NDUFA9 subunit family protein [Thermodesulfovibrionales bacterium]